MPSKNNSLKTEMCQTDDKYILFKISNLYILEREGDWKPVVS